MGSSSSSVATFSLSNLSYIKSGKRKNNEKEIISSILAPSYLHSKKISPNNQTTTNKSGPSKYKTHNSETSRDSNNEDNDDMQTQVQRKNSSKRQQQNSKRDPLPYYGNEEIGENSKLSSLEEYNNHTLPLVIGDTVHILEENGEGKLNVLTFIAIKIFFDFKQ